MTKTKSTQTASARVVVGIDLGASGAGFAYALTSDGRIVGNNVWPGQPRPAPKTSTHLLYGPNRKVLAWGHPAARRYAELVGRGEERGHELFEGLHDALRTAKLRTARGPVVERSGRRYPVVDLLSDYLRLMKAAAWSKVRGATAAELREREVLWCLTVPASWGEPETQLLQKAAQKAGLVSARAADARRLLVVPEPHALAVHCQEKDAHSLAPGSQVVIVDAGSAVGVVAYRMTRQRTLRPIASTVQCLPGSGELDRAFVEGVLRDRLSAEVLETYRREEPLDFYEVMAEWERIKCNFDPETSLGASTIDIRPRLLMLLMRRFPKAYKRLTSDEDDRICIEHDDMASIFEPVVAATVEGIREALRRIDARRCDFLYLAGGLAGSPLFRQRIETLFRHRFGKVVVPPVPAAAVVEGAVSYALEPTVLRVCRSRLAYGFGCETPFDTGADDERREVFCYDLDAWYCRDRFLPFVQAGDAVVPGRRATYVLSPMTRLQTEILIDLYSSGKTDARYLDEDGVEKLGELRVKIPDTEDTEREVELSAELGENTIEVRARVRGSRRSRRLTLPLSSSFSPSKP